MRAWSAFNVQTRYIGLQIPKWLADQAFAGFQPERSEDVDVVYDIGGRVVRDLHQVKTGDLTVGEIKALVENFHIRNGVLLISGALRNFFIAAPHLHPKARSLAEALRIFRSRNVTGDPLSAKATGEDLARTIKRAGFGSLVKFVVAAVHFDQDFGGMEPGATDSTGRVALALHKLRELRDLSVAELEHATTELLRRIEDGQSRFWSRTEITQVLRNSVQVFRVGPPKSRGDLLLVSHETHAKVIMPPEPQDAPDLFKDRRIIPVGIDRTASLAGGDWSTVGDAVADLVRKDGPYLTALARANSEVLYFGFPHVPLGMLAGYVAGQQRHVALAEHDRDTGRFAWRPSGSSSTVEIDARSGTPGKVLIVRISVSANVDITDCHAVVPTADVRLDLHFRAQDIGRGVLKTEADARAFATSIRQGLDKYVVGNPSIAEVHVFAAVPVSLAFLIGQVLSASGFPRCLVHNYRHTDSPRYKWSLCLQEAAQANSGIRIAS